MILTELPPHTSARFLPLQFNQRLCILTARTSSRSGGINRESHSRLFFVFLYVPLEN